MRKTYIRRPKLSYQRKPRQCMACPRKFPARFELITSEYFPEGRTAWIDHVCPSCTASNNSAAAGLRGGVEYPEASRCGEGMYAEVRKRATPVGPDLGWSGPNRRVSAERQN